MECRSRLAPALALLPPGVTCLVLDLGHLAAADATDVLPVVKAWAARRSVCLVRIGRDDAPGRTPVRLVHIPRSEEERSLPHTLAARVIVQRARGIRLAHRTDPPCRTS
ncbi:hypothetical protein [Streptomyces sp. NPDC090036]|uniref:hypothetical protein n=1 Tax=Streptomyces sp. NPDC090036 TaxID=3365926 RepID=UPI003829D953